MGNCMFTLCDVYIKSSLQDCIPHVHRQLTVVFNHYDRTSSTFYCSCFSLKFLRNFSHLSQFLSNLWTRTAIHLTLELVKTLWSIYDPQVIHEVRAYWRVWNWWMKRGGSPCVEGALMKGERGRGMKQQGKRMTCNMDRSH